MEGEKGTTLVGNESSQEDVADQPVQKKYAKRDQWGNGFEFVIACAGYAVGLGNIWRFPYLCYKNGGGAFLVPYLLFMVLGSAPVFFMEVSLGQFMSQGNISVWKLCPIFKGIGLGSTVIIIYSDIYYIVLLCWAFHYFFSSFTLGTLPWSSCDNYWNSPECITGEVHHSTVNGSVDSAVEYWEKRVLNRSDGLDEIGGFQWELVGCLALSWIVVYFFIFKGVKLSGKIVYFTALFPYLMLSILLVRGVTLPGALDGLKYYLRPDFNRLKDPEVWTSAGSQVFYTFACTFGGMLTMGSYNKYHRDFVRDCTIISGINVFSSLFGGLVIFSVIGYMSYISGVSIDQVAESGPGLAFIVYPKALSLMPVAPLWAVLFFFMLLNVAIDSQFVCVEALVTAILDEFASDLHQKYAREAVTAVVCILCFLCGLPMMTEGGIYIFQIFDYYACSGIVLFVFCFCEVCAISYGFGIEKWCSNIESMIGRKVNPFLKFTWTISCPCICLGLLLISVVLYSPVTYNSYVFPPHGLMFGLALTFSSIVFIPLYFFYALIKAPGVKLSEKWRNATQSDMAETQRLRRLQMVDESPPKELTVICLQPEKQEKC